MSSSSIIVPVIALVIWSLLEWLMYIPCFLRLVFADDFDPPLTEEQRQRNAERGDRRYRNFREQPVLFYIVCLALANLDAGSGLATWLAWAYAASWAATRMPALSHKHLRCGAHSVVVFSLYPLAIYAGIRVTSDLLVTAG